MNRNVIVAPGRYFFFDRDVTLRQIITALGVEKCHGVKPALLWFGSEFKTVRSSCLDVSIAISVRLVSASKCAIESSAMTKLRVISIT